MMRKNLMAAAAITLLMTTAVLTACGSDDDNNDAPALAAPSLSALHSPRAFFNLLRQNGYFRGNCSPRT